ncbi:DUF475 domain-containing protein [Motilibacter aurantiacus]|uniref:DUF475 domain-containing protein n=1 Tax=Motilibacter aurantiacus TaxID=2714955 RepID=UPI001408F901|nr:DUF475 domain-containing protein [Motilibacter aurantiacus]NHC43690.1 DUF475 domain-containing protein [Motilibacter aurantiacus]
MILRTFGWSFGITAVGLIAALVLGGPEALVLVAILSILEISLSFDNAVVNAKILVRMSDFWQKIFLTIGIAIAVFGMRLVFPLLIVGITAQLSPVEAIRLANEGGSAEEEGTYAYLLHEAHPDIAAFGGMFLLMLFLDWLFDEEREHHWLGFLERPLAKLGQLDALAVVLGLGALALAAETLAEEPGEVLLSGVLGVMTYLLVNGLGSLFESQGIADDGEDAAPARRGGPSQAAKATGKAGFFLFLYLEVLDASFSFDGVIGAFAISNNIYIIAAGLGIGAMYIRSLTVYLVRKGTLSQYIYLEHGAHWAIGALAVIMLVSIGHEVPEVITGLIGVAFIGAALLSSLQHNKNVGHGEIVTLDGHVEEHETSIPRV